ncbi:hypothetical protein Taro_031595 [Colocasia esculenta]|uniref:Uncharacterized protein n=1 Tax=Colocasia esculenta TaxID=4460 RepID=A0A843W6W1_COLES|nr:hypothetical protein [Colocasia esculenta]
MYPLHGRGLLLRSGGFARISPEREPLARAIGGEENPGAPSVGEAAEVPCASFSSPRNEGLVLLFIGFWPGDSAGVRGLAGVPTHRRRGTGLAEVPRTGAEAGKARRDSGEGPPGHCWLGEGTRPGRGTHTDRGRGPPDQGWPGGGTRQWVPRRRPARGRPARPGAGLAGVHPARSGGGAPRVWRGCTSPDYLAGPAGVHPASAGLAGPSSFEACLLALLENLT